jgi:asparagine synthetase B (glutamine-hydrolysing)
MDKQTLYAARDPNGFRPLVLGRLDTGWVVASETAALDIVGARFVREIAPGELVCIDGRGCGPGPSRPLSTALSLDGKEKVVRLSLKRQIVQRLLRQVLSTFC